MTGRRYIVRAEDSPILVQLAYSYEREVMRTRRRLTTVPRGEGRRSHSFTIPVFTIDVTLRVMGKSLLSPQFNSATINTVPFKDYGTTLQNGLRTNNAEKIGPPGD